MKLDIEFYRTSKDGAAFRKIQSAKSGASGLLVRGDLILTRTTQR